MAIFLSGVLFVLLLCYLPLMSVLLGEVLTDRIGVFYRLPPLRSAPPCRERWVEFLALGLAAWLMTLVALTCCRLGLPLAVLLSVLLSAPLLVRGKLWLRAIGLVRSVNQVIWGFATLCLGAGLLNTFDGYSTAWVNNYGDFTWHAGMISSFVFGDNLPPLNHIYPGERLFYPFLINLWTAAHWFLLPYPTALSYIFLFQWMLCWTGVYAALDGNRVPAAPWAALLGGGSYILLSRASGFAVPPAVAAAEPYAHNLFGIGYPWAPFLTTVWVCQRPAMFGCFFLLVFSRIFHRGYAAVFGGAKCGDGLLNGQPGERSENERRGLCDLTSAAALLGLSPLIHTHFFLVESLYAGMMMAAVCWWRKPVSRLAFTAVRGMALASLPALGALYWIIGKASIVHVVGGWMQDTVHQTAGFTAAAREALVMWYHNAWPVVAMAFLFVTITRRWRPVLVLSVLFCAGNVVQIAVWNWDQAKVFIAIYLLFLSLWAAVADEGVCTGRTGEVCSKTMWPMRVAQWGLLALTVPALVEVGVALQRYSNYTIYTKDEQRIAQAIREQLPKGAVIAGNPGHNSLITLTGHPIYFGYEGTLSSHGIQYQDRKMLFTDLPRLVNCRTDAIGAVQGCPDYLLWTAREKEFWKRPSLDGLNVIPTDIPEVFALPGAPKP